MTEKIVEVLIPLMIPLQQAGAPPPPRLAGGPEDVFAFLMWIGTRPGRKRRKKRLVLSPDQKRTMTLLRTLDAARMLQLARANAAVSW